MKENRWICANGHYFGPSIDDESVCAVCGCGQFFLLNGDHGEWLELERDIQACILEGTGALCCHCRGCTGNWTEVDHNERTGTIDNAAGTGAPGYGLCERYATYWMIFFRGDCPPGDSECVLATDGTDVFIARYEKGKWIDREGRERSGRAWAELPDPFDDDIIAGLYPDRACRVCGCTEDHACEGGCHWVAWDLCSKCQETPQ